MNNKNLYDILELPKNCSRTDIKKAYRKLAILYHPDKCKNINTEQDKTIASEKFINIHNAYEILYDPDKRARYDSLKEDEQDELYNNFTTFINKYLIKFFFNNDITFKEYMEKMDLVGMYDKIINRFSNIDSDIDLDNLSYSKSCHKTPIDINIIGKINTTLNDKYHDRYRKLHITRETKEELILCIPLKNDTYILHNEGEYDNENDKHGDIILSINQIDEAPENMVIDMENHNIYLTEYISLHDYLYGGELIISLFDEKIIINSTGFLENVPMIIYENYGMPYCNDNNKLCRGKLTIIFKIKSLNELKPILKNILI